MNKYSLESLLRLYSVPGIGPGKMRLLINNFGSPDEVIGAPVQKLTRIPGIEKKTAEKIRSRFDDEYVKRQLDLINDHGVTVYSYWDDEYPSQLKNIYDSPAFIFVKGKFIEQDRLAVAIVGSRLPSSYGRVITDQFTRELCDAGLTIVSGMARGVDTVAHKQAVKCGGRTIAVLGSGLDIVYPPENKALAKQIEENGVLVSEYPMGTKPDAMNFPRRNRIISGLSLGVLITEAGSKSGALITAFQALEQNREVFAVPGPIHSGKSSGSNQLIKEGAKLVQGTQDILQELEGHLSQKVKQPARPKIHLKGLEKIIFDTLNSEPMHVDKIAEACRRSTPEILSVLFTLELMGVIRQLSGKMFIKS